MHSKLKPKSLCAIHNMYGLHTHTYFVYKLATSPPLCLDPDPRLGKIANSLYRISLPRTPPPLRPKKRKANGVGSTEEDEASVNRKTKIIRFMDPKPTRSATPSYVLFFNILHSLFLMSVTLEISAT